MNNRAQQQIPALWGGRGEEGVNGRRWRGGDTPTAGWRQDRAYQTVLPRSPDGEHAAARFTTNPPNDFLCTIRLAKVQVEPCVYVAIRSQPQVQIFLVKLPLLFVDTPSPFHLNLKRCQLRHWEIKYLALSSRRPPSLIPSCNSNSSKPHSPWSAITWPLIGGLDSTLGKIT